MAKKIGNQPAAHVRSKNVENHIRKCIEGGVSMREMFASMAHFQDAPKSYQTLYKHYGDLIYSLRADLNAEIGKTVIDQARAGDFKSQELFLRSKAGWSPKETVETADAIDEDTDESAIDLLMTLLGKASDEEDEEPDESCEEEEEYEESPETDEA